jgi:preprotein translocase subunit SecF
MSGRLRRLYYGDTAIDFYGRRKIAFITSLVAVVITVFSLIFQGLELGIDFKGGVAWEAPVSGQLTTDSARDILTANGVQGANAKIQTLTSGSDQRIRVQVGELTEETRVAIQQAFATSAGVDVVEVSVADVSSSWGRSITEKAVRALLVFIVVASLFIAWRFEWKMAIAAIVAMLHDVVLSIGVYALFQLEVTPATVVAFLTILGFSLYDTIVVFDCVKDNARRLTGTKTSYGDVINVSMNEVLMRSVNTTISTLIPVLSLLVVGSWIMGATSLREFAIALLVGLAFGTYSSIYIAAPLLGVLKSREDAYRPYADSLATGDDLVALIQTGAVAKRRSTAGKRNKASDSDRSDRYFDDDLADDIVVTGTSSVSPGQANRESDAVETLLSHPPRPRKKSRR